MTDWREELIEKMARYLSAINDVDPEPYSEWCDENWHYYEPVARVALVIAEPVIRERCAKIADHRAEMGGNVPNEYSLACRHIASAIREGGKDE